MAVPVEKIKERVKAKWPNANLSTKRLDALAAKLAPKPADGSDDAAVDLVLEDFNGILSFEEMAREDDRIRTLEANHKPKPTDPPTPPTPPVDPPTPPADTPEWAKALIESNKALTEKVTNIESGKITDSKKNAAQTAFEKSEVLKGLNPAVKENWLKRIAVTPETTDEDIATQVAGLETEFTTMQQHIADTYGYSGPPPTDGGAIKGSDDKVIDSVVNSFNI